MSALSHTFRPFVNSKVERSKRRCTLTCVLFKRFLLGRGYRFLHPKKTCPEGVPFEVAAPPILSVWALT